MHYLYKGFPFTETSEQIKSLSIIDKLIISWYTGKHKERKEEDSNLRKEKVSNFIFAYAERIWLKWNKQYVRRT